MGNHINITGDKFPKQYPHVRVNVMFHYDTRTACMGSIVRDDKEAPYVSIIKLDEGRHVLTTECQYSPVK